MDDFINSVIMGILNPILNLFRIFFNFVFASKLSTLLFGFIFMNLLGFVLMYVDKKRAKEEKFRIKEFTLFLTAFFFGSLGILAGMYKFRHKTLHKSFTIGIPFILVAQIIFVIYACIKGWLF